jgi:hypothetical protein
MPYFTELDLDPWNHTTDLQIQIRIWDLIFSSVAFKMPTENRFFPQFFPYFFLRVRLYQSLKIKSYKEVTNSRNQGFSSLLFLLDNERIRILIQILEKKGKKPSPLQMRVWNAPITFLRELEDNPTYCNARRNLIINYDRKEEKIFTEHPFLPDLYVNLVATLE